MKKMFACIALLTLCLPALAQDNLDARLRALEVKVTALETKKPCCQCECGCGETGVCTCGGKTSAKVQDAYAEARQTAMEEKSPLVVYVGNDNRKIRSTVGVAVEAGRFAKDEYPTRCIIVSNPDGSWRATLPATATDAEIEAALRPRVAAPPTSFYAPPMRSGGC